MTGGTPPLLTGPQVSPHLDWPMVVEAIDAGHRLPRAQVEDLMIHREAETLLTRSAWIEGLGAGTKSVTVIPANQDRGLPTVQGAMLLFAEGTGQIEAVIDNALITNWKTVADSLAGARRLARPDSRQLLIVGAGAVARNLVAGYRAVFPGLEVAIWNRTPARAEALAAETGTRAVPDLQAALRSADIVSTATLAREPILPGAWLRPGTHVDLIGAFTPAMREADDDALTRAEIFVDSRDTTLAHIGELADPLARGVIAKADVRGDLYQLVAGAAGRGGPQAITLYKNGGGAHLDLMVARLMLDVWRRARG